MRDLLRPMLPMIVVLAVPIVPFLLFGERVEQWLTSWRDHPPAWPLVAAGVVLLLATDVFLPIPSSLVSTLAGSHLGALGGTLAAWLGMSAGAILGFAVARGCGPPLVRWLTRAEDLERTGALVERFGPLLLVLGRGVPVLAEATVLLFGMHGLTWRRFLPPVLLANLALACAYSLFGDVAQQYDSVLLALAVSILLPVMMVAAFRSWTKAMTSGQGDVPKDDPPANHPRHWSGL